MKLVQCLLLFFIIGGLFFSSHSYVIANESYDRIAGDDRYETAALISKQGWENGSEVAVIARGDEFADALTGSPLAKKLEAPILLSKFDQLPDVTKSELTRLKTKKVILLGGEAALSNSVKEKIEDMGIKVERIGGIDRFDTSLKIAERIGSKDTAVIATGLKFADALAIAPYAAEKQYPILLTRQDRLEKSVYDYINDFSETIVVGGEQAVSSKVEEKLPSSLRLAGETRYETAAEIIRNFYDSNDHIFVSTGMEFADALTGSLLAVYEKTAVMLVAPDKVPDRMKILVGEQKIRSFQVFGGPKAVTDEVVKELNITINEYKDTQGGATFSDEVIILTNNQEALLEEAIKQATIFDNGTFEVTVPSTSPLASYQKDQLLLIPPDEDEPNGLMLQIGAKTKNGKEITLLLGQPAVEDMFEEIKFSGEKEFSQEDIINLELHDGVTIATPNGEQASSFEEFEKTVLKKSSSQLAKSNNFEFGSIELFINSTLYEKEDMEVTLEGTMELSDMVGSTDMKKSWGKMKSFDMAFKADQLTKTDLLVNWNGDIFPMDKADDDKKILEGVDRSERISLAEITFSVGGMAVGEKAGKKIPIGVTVFVVTSLDGEMELKGKLSYIDEQTHNMDVDWKSKENKFNASSTTEQVTSEASLDVKGTVDISQAAGLDAGLTILGLIPAVVENEVRQSLYLEGTGTILLDFLESELTPEVQGCFLADYDIDFNSDFKARLKAAVGKWEFGFEYEKELLRLKLYETGFDLCFPSGAVTGSVSDAVTKEKLEDVKVVAYKDGEKFRSGNTDETGAYSLDLQPGLYKLVYKKDGYQEEIYNGAEVTRDGLTYNPELKLVSDEHVGVGEVSGQITNALNGNEVEGARIEFRKGMNVKEGEVTEAVVTEADGRYIVDLNAGSYTGTITKEGYITATFTVISVGGYQLQNQNAAMTPLLDDRETRIVLSWGEEPLDLDSHLLGPAQGNDRFHIFFADQNYYEDGELVATLDHDDRFSYGPETITLSQTKEGVYNYFVHDYSNRLNNDSTDLSKSDAKVEVYKGSQLVKTFYVPTNKSGVVWKVFTMENGQITPINEVTKEYTNESSVRNSPSRMSEIEKSLLKKK